MDESPRRRRYGGYSGRAPPDPIDTPAGASRVESHELDGHFDRRQSGGAWPRHFRPATLAPPPSELRHVAAQPRYHGSGRCSGGSLPRPAPPAVRPDDQQRASPYIRDRDHSDDGRGRGAGECRHETSYSRGVEPGDRPTYQDDDGNNYYQRRGRTDRSAERSSRASRPVLPTLKLGTYNGSTCLRTFLSKFENCYFRFLNMVDVISEISDNIA